MLILIFEPKMFLPAFLLEPVSSLPIAFFRITFAIFLLYNTWKFSDIHRYFQLHTFNIGFFSWLKPFRGLQYLTYLRFLVLFGLLLGLPFCAAFATLLFFHLLLLDKTLYFDTIYLQGLFLFLLALTDSDKSLSIQNLGIEQVPFWHVFAFQSQLFLVFFYKGLAKLQKDWLFRQEPLREFFRFFVYRKTNGGEALYRFGGALCADKLHKLFNQRLFLCLIAYLLILVEFSICPLIFYPPTHLWGIALYLSYCLCYDLFSEQVFWAYEHYLFLLFLIKPEILESIFKSLGVL